jgi:Ca-activated chloride channel family protein
MSIGTQNWKVAMLVSSLVFLPCALLGQAAPASLDRVEVFVEDANGGVLTGLGVSDFEMKRGKAICPVISVAQDDEPITIGILVDTSRSMNDRLQNPEALKDVIKTFLERSHPNNTYFLVEFASGADLLVDYTQDHQRLLDALPHSRRAGGTLLLETLRACDEKLRQRQGRKALFVVSDGLDVLSDADGSALPALDLPVFGLCPMVAGDDFQPRWSELARVCEETGGVFRQDAQMSREAGRMAALLRGAYRIGFSCGAPGKDKLKLSLKGSGVKRHGRLIYSKRRLAKS